MSFKTWLKSFKDVELLYGRHIFVDWVEDWLITSKLSDNRLRILDFGCGYGDDLTNIHKSLRSRGHNIIVEMYGLESYPPNQEICRQKGIHVSACNLENEIFPYKDQFFDIVISNQTVEHTKEIFWIFSEVSRVLKPGGLSITGAPNLASFHNRVLLLFGKQPTPIEMLGPHVRGITLDSFQRFIECDDYFKVEKTTGSYFYPFPKPFAVWLANIFPNAAGSIFLAAKRTEKPGRYIDILKTRFFETPFFTGK